MSAPWEVMIHSPIDAPQAAYATSIDGGAMYVLLRMNVRYLRADLTCGECAFLKEDSDYSVLCVKHSWEIAAENPACMAFVPKHDRKGER